MGEHRKKLRLTPSLAAAQRSARPAPRRKWLNRTAVLVVVVVVAVTALFILLWPGRNREGRVYNPAAVAPAGAAQGKAPETTASSEGRPEALMREAVEQMNRGDVQGAIGTYKRALELAPEDEDLHYNLGIAYGRAGSLTNSEHHYREALRILPDYPEAHNNYGNLLMRLGRMDEAEQHFKEAVKILPEYAVAHNSLGTLLKQQNRSEEALACFQNAVRYNSNYWQARFNLASSFLAAGERDKAAAELRATLRLNPTFDAAQQELDKLEGVNIPFPAK